MLLCYTVRLLISGNLRLSCLGCQIEHPHSRQAELLTSGSTRRQRASERQMEGVEQLPWPPQATLQACPHLPSTSGAPFLIVLLPLSQTHQAKTCAC